MAYTVFAVVFNMLLTFLFAISTACAFFMYRMKKLPGFAAIIAIFVSYIIDNVIVFCTEIIPPFADIYDRMFLETPSVKTVCFIIRISSMLYLLSRALPAFSMNAVMSFTALHAFALICVPIISQPDWMVYFYYFFSQFIIICVCTWSLLQLRNSGKGTSNMLVKRVLLYFLLMSVLVLLEDTYVIFFVDVYTNTGLSIFNRNFSENLLFIGFAIGFIVYTVHYMDDVIALSNAASIQTEDSTVQQIDHVRYFANTFNLTDRELEILRSVLEGKSHQEISESLEIALGTVKTHTHNIYSKAGVSNRSQIVCVYRDFLKQFDDE